MDTNIKEDSRKHIIDHFGAKKINDELLDRFRDVIKCEPHIWLNEVYSSRTETLD